MDKHTAIELCKEISADGMFAMPRLSNYGDWEIVLHSTAYNRDIARFERMYDLRFIDFTFQKWEGVNKTQDYPIFFRRS